MKNLALLVAPLLFMAGGTCLAVGTALHLEGAESRAGRKRACFAAGIGLVLAAIVTLAIALW